LTESVCLTPEVIPSVGRHSSRASVASATEIYVVTELPRLSVARDQPDLAALLEGTWRLLSGFEHGFGWAPLRGADRGAEANIPGGMTVHLVINDEEFVTAARATYLLLMTACRLLKRRHLEPSRHHLGG
jgi:hypothetical protein